MSPSESNQTLTNRATVKAQAQLKKPVLRRGAKGQAVIELQELLSQYDLYNGSLNGIFDFTIERAVKTFQHRVFLVEDGIVGQLTWQALYSGAPVNMPMLRRGDQGQVVITLQKVLYAAKDFNDVFNGVFGPNTEAAVLAFQKRNGLVVDGIVGKKTWFALSKVPH